MCFGIQHEQYAAESCYSCMEHHKTCFHSNDAVLTDLGKTKKRRKKEASLKAINFAGISLFFCPIQILIPTYIIGISIKDVTSSRNFSLTFYQIIVLIGQIEQTNRDPNCNILLQNWNFPLVLQCQVLNCILQKSLLFTLFENIFFSIHQFNRLIPYLVHCLVITNGHLGILLSFGAVTACLFFLL